MDPLFRVLFYFLVAEVLGDQTPAFDSTEVPSVTWPDWMASLPDHLPLSSLAIPGTHDTMAFYGGSLAECQSWRLENQYKAGIRFLDIRCRHYQDRLPIFHGVSYQRTDFVEVLIDTVRFLTEYPTETVLMRVKEEYEPYQNTRSFYKSVAEVVESIGQHWFLRTNYLPTLGEARGKVIILQNFQSLGEGPDFGPPYPGSMSISDEYQVTDDNEKWKEVERHLNVAQSGDPKMTYLTYSSGVHWLLYPPKNLAYLINPRLHEFLSAIHSLESRSRSVGVVILDFPGAELVREIILDNWK
ncbi:1-phosphatidylinositol phosphodiesterase-like [Spea bombifrons]|uniref:1-phosphatidylinositol phosphodiesterase-like n=1 Tax=Spea bombifrons TaxID=233779 RepID=UPI00234AD1AA|nr:1-phosphatidylinositol phosphodiesterase-like [Spea bombifrons]XP_053319601.1 1-phosphatidylinositol phosphodiesterase-like [Spea bombifrons]